MLFPLQDALQCIYDDVKQEKGTTLTVSELEKALVQVFRIAMDITLIKPHLLKIFDYSLHRKIGQCIHREHKKRNMSQKEMAICIHIPIS